MEYMTDRKRVYRFTDWGLSRGMEGICPTLLAAMGSRFERIPFFYDDYSIRLMTPRECARLQGFPDWWCSGLETDDPTEEIIAARTILDSLGLSERAGMDIVSCPTCGRTQIDLIGLVNQVDEALKNCEKPITVAVMGCVVNGPGEAREADIGIAGGDGWGMIFEKGQQVEKLPYEELLPALLNRIEKL